MAYNKDTDYQELINKAVASKDYASAAQYEQQRNEKIADLDASGTNIWGATATNKYSSYLTDQKSSSGAGSSSAGSSGKSTSGKSSAPSGYAGSSQNVTTHTSQQDAIKAQMNANSKAWYSADDAGKEALHAENERLAALLGGSVSYDENAGTWSGSAWGGQGEWIGGGRVFTDDVPSAASQTAYVNDYSSYLRDMNAAQKRASMAALNSAYEQEMAAIDRAERAIPEAYQSARNQTAGASELAARNFNEYAAASGLNSGTGGQAALARNVTLQNNLNSIDTEEADAISSLELQRTQAEIEYNNAIAQAEAGGNYELAAALYQEKVRYDNAMLAAIQQEYQNDLTAYQLNYQAQRDAVGDSQWQQSFDASQRQYQDSLALQQAQLQLQQQQYADSQAQSQNANLVEYGNAFLQQGIMPSSEMLAAMGITAADAQAYIAAGKAVGGGDSGGSGNSSSGSGSGGSSSGSGNTGDEGGSADYNGLFAAAQGSGYPRSFIANHYKKYGFTSSTGLYDEYTQWEADAGDNGNGLKVDMGSVLALGYGPISEARLNELVQSGEVEEYEEDGYLRFRKVTTPSNGLFSLPGLG